MVHHFTFLTLREPTSIIGRIENIIWKAKEKHQLDPPPLPLQNTTHHLSQIGPLRFPPQGQHIGATLTMSSISCTRKLFPFAKMFATLLHRWKWLTLLTPRRQISYSGSSIAFNVKLLQLRHPDRPRSRDTHCSLFSSIHHRPFHHGGIICFYSYYY